MTKHTTRMLSECHNPVNETRADVCLIHMCMSRCLQSNTAEVEYVNDICNIELPNMCNVFHKGQQPGTAVSGKLLSAIQA